MSIPSGDATPIITGTPAGNFTIGRNSNNRLYDRNQSQGGLVERDLGTGAERFLTKGPGARELKVSPDGRQLLLGVSNGIGILDLATGTVRDRYRLDGPDQRRFSGAVECRTVPTFT